MFYSFTTGAYQLSLALFRQKIKKLFTARLLQKNTLKVSAEFQPCVGLHHEAELKKELLEQFFFSH